MLCRALAEYEATPTTEADAYMTLVGYFNSLRELGGALRLVDERRPCSSPGIAAARIWSPSPSLREIRVDKQSS